MINKNIKMLLFVTLCVLLIGIVSAESIDSDDSIIETDTIPEEPTDTLESLSDVNDNVADDNINLKKDITTKKSIKTDTSPKAIFSFDEIKNVNFDEGVLINGTLRDVNNKSLPYYDSIFINIDNEHFTTIPDDYGHFSIEYHPKTLGLKILNAQTAKGGFDEAFDYSTVFNVIGPAETHIELYTNTYTTPVMGSNVTISGKYYYGNYIPLTFTTMRININGKTYTAKTDDYGWFYYKYIPTKDGTYNVTAYYPGNTNFKGSNESKTFEVKTPKPIYTHIYLNEIKDVTIGETSTISGYYYHINELPLTYTNMRINIDGKTYTAKTDNNGFFTFKYKQNKTETQKVTVSYPGNSNFEKAEAIRYLSVYPHNTSITLNDVKDVVYGENTTISGYYYYKNNIPLTYTPMEIHIDNQFHTKVKTDAKGFFSYTYAPVTVNKKTITVLYRGNSNFNGSTANKTFNVKITSPLDTKIILDYFKEGDATIGETRSISGKYYYQSWSSYQGSHTLHPLTYTNMRIKINDQVYTTKTDQYGHFTYKFKTNKTGTNNITVYYPGNSNFKNASASRTFYVRGAGPQNTYFVLSNISDKRFDDYVGVGGYYYYGDNRPLTYTPVTLNINGNKYTTKTDDKGHFLEIFSTMHFGKNTVTASYHGNTNFKAASATKTFNVYAETPIKTDIRLTKTEINNVKVGDYVTVSGYYTYGYGDGEPLTQTPMRIEINGKTYTAKTDNNGYFTYTYKNTRNDTYYIDVSYPGNKNFQSASSYISVNYDN